MSSNRQEMLSLWSDLHKDAYGFRPRDWDRVNALSDEQLSEEFNSMSAYLDQIMDEEKVAKANAARVFEARVLEVIDAGAKDRASAIRWIAEAEDANHGGHIDLGFLEYLLRLPYGYLTSPAAE